MVLIIAAFLANLGLISYRFLRFTPPVRKSDPLYLAILAGCLLADLVASCGFYVLIHTPAAHIRSYSLIITLLSLLAAVALIGKFAFYREGTRPAQRLLAWASSVLVMVSLYLLFGSIAFFSKVIQDTNFILVAYLFIPAMMLTILWINTAYDSWDFAERSDPLRDRLSGASEQSTRS
jgi:hypothetical protein